MRDEYFQDELLSGNGKSEFCANFSTSQPVVLQFWTQFRTIPRNREIHFHAGVCRTPIRLRLRLTYIRPDRVNDVVIVIFYQRPYVCGAMYNITRKRDEAAAAQ